MEPAEYQAWLAGRPAAGVAGGRGGEALHRAHLRHLPPAGPRRAAGRSCTGLFGQPVKLASGGHAWSPTRPTCASRSSNPAAKVVAGYQPIMPTFQGLVSEEELMQLVAYIKSLQVPAEAAPASDGGAVARTEGGADERDDRTESAALPNGRTT